MVRIRGGVRAKRPIGLTWYHNFPASRNSRSTPAASSRSLPIAAAIRWWARWGCGYQTIGSAVDAGLPGLWGIRGGFEWIGLVPDRALAEMEAELDGDAS